jgi:hypothetical protein
LVTWITSRHERQQPKLTPKISHYTHHEGGLVPLRRRKQAVAQGCAVSSSFSTTSGILWVIFQQLPACWALESSLDVQIAHAISLNCKILLVYATSNSFSDLLKAEDYAVAHPRIVFNSLSGREFS